MSIKIWEFDLKTSTMIWWYILADFHIWIPMKHFLFMIIISSPFCFVNRLSGLSFCANLSKFWFCKLCVWGGNMKIFSDFLQCFYWTKRISDEWLVLGMRILSLVFALVRDLELTSISGILVIRVQVLEDLVQILPQL